MDQHPVELLVDQSLELRLVEERQNLRQTDFCPHRILCHKILHVAVQSLPFSVLQEVGGGGGGGMECQQMNV